MTKQQTANKMADTAVVTENKQRKDDFTPKYYNAQAIKDDKELQPAEQVCELIKHYSMCLFGIATDMGNFYGQLAERDKKIAKLTAANSSLRQRNMRLSLQVTMQDKNPQEVLDELFKTRKDNTHLKQALQRYKVKCDNLLSDTAIAELNQKIDKLRQNCIYWQERAKSLEALNKALTERKTDGK